MFLTRMLIMALGFMTDPRLPPLAGERDGGTESMTQTIKSELKEMMAAIFAGVLLVSIFILSLMGLANLFHNSMVTVENGWMYEIILLVVALIMSGSALYYFLHRRSDQKKINVSVVPEVHDMAHIIPRSASSFINGFISAFDQPAKHS